MTYIAPYMNPNFSQCLDKTRPHTLLTKNSKRMGCLTYRYDDTGDEALVPNIWYNQTYQIRVEAVRWDAGQMIERAVRYETEPPLGMAKWQSDQIAQRYRARAARIYAEADRMEAAGDDKFPVVAACLQLNYGENVSL